MMIVDINKMPKAIGRLNGIKAKNKFKLQEINKIFNLSKKIVIAFIIFISTLIVNLSILFINKEKGEREKFQNKFVINTKINSLSQFLMNLNQIHYSISGKMKYDFSHFIKAKYDIFTLNESLLKKENNFYSKIYFTTIIINSICFEFQENKTNCILEKYLDLTIKNKNKLIINKEILEEIKEAILPICLIEHSSDNNILSVTCPETLSDNLKNNIMIAFQNIKPNLSKGKILQNNSTNNSEKIIYINMNDNSCKNYILNENQICKTITKISTDENGNVKEINKIYKSKFIKDDKNRYYNNLNYSFEEISNKNDNSGDIENNFKYNLKQILELINPLMKKKEYQKLNELNELNRKLEDKNFEKLGVNDEDFFSQKFFGLNLSLNLKNDFGFGKNEKSKLITSLLRGNEYTELYYDQINSNINETLNKFIVLSKAGNKLANLLYENVNRFLSILPNIFFSKIKELNDLLHFEDLSPIFDSISSIDSLKILPFSIVSASKNLYSNIQNLSNNIENTIGDIKNKLKDNISFFLDESHNLIFNILMNLIQLSTILFSDNGKITCISNYYLNNNNIYYGDIINKIKLIIDNYYIDEKKIIENLLYGMFMEFPNKFIDSLTLSQILSNNIINRLQNKSLTIFSGNNSEIKLVITNLINTKEKIYEIIPIIEILIKKGIGINENEYLETKEEIEKNNRNYGDIYEKSMKIISNIDNNLLIDNIFDNIMINFKKKFLNFLNYIEKSKREKFSLNTNIYVNSSFIRESFYKMDRDLKEEKIIIINYIKNENQQYLYSIQNIKESFILKNESYLENLINNIDSQLSEKYLYNLDSKYNEMLNMIFISINNIIENNRILANQYLIDIVNSKSSHRTQAFLTKATIFLNSFSIIKNFIQLSLKNNLSNEYSIIINQITNNLLIIKTNTIIQKYLSYLPFLDRHIRQINTFLNRFDRYFSISLFNIKYEQIIDNYISTTINKINEIEVNLNGLLNKVQTLAYSSDTTNDYYTHRQNCYKKCSKKILGKCVSHKTICDDYYDGHIVCSSNNYLSLQSIDFAQYTLTFEIFYNNIYSIIQNNITSYINILNSFENTMNLIKKQILNKQNNYLNDISQKINYFMTDKFCNDFIVLVYNYFKSELKDKLISQLKDISNKFNIILDEINIDINMNIDKFKYSIQEFGSLSVQYYKIYYQNISYDYINSIIEQRKNDFNYTINYFYNMLLLKVNKTYSTIINNIPINEELFNDILNKRNNEIKTSFNNYIGQIHSTKNKYLQNQNQLNIIGVNNTNFFNINSDIENYKLKINTQIISKIEENIKSIKNNNKGNTIESIISKLYLENILYEKEIKEIHELKRETFIDLEGDVYKNLVEETVEIDHEELTKNIINYLKKSNNLILKEFKNEKNNYENILQNKIFKEFYTKINLQSKIDNIYSNGLKNLDTNSKNTIYGYLNEVLINIKSHISNEIYILSNQLTSYSDNFTIIQNRFSNFKNSIYNKFYNAILSANNDFYSQIITKFYKNYIDKYLEEFLDYAKSEKFEEFKFLNISLNLKHIKKEIIEKLIKEYKDLTLNHINYLNQKNFQQLDNLFSFLTIKNTINNELESIYNNQLLPILKNIAIYKSGDEGISNYDLSNTILQNITSFTDTKIIQSKQIINKMKGNLFNIQEDWIIPDFSLVKREEFSIIKNSFNIFYNFYHDKEINEFNLLISENIKYNFKLILENFIPSFGKDYFEKIFKYNEIQKTKIIYNNLKYSLNQTLNYYNEILTLYPSIIMPEDLKNKILDLNNIESLVTSMNNEQIIKLNKKFDNIFEETKGYFIDNYIYSLKEDYTIKFAFDENIKSFINNILDYSSKNLENDYLNLIDINIRNIFMEKYKKNLNEESNFMIKYINDNKNIIKSKINSINVLKTDIIILNIENKFSDILDSIDNYYIYLDDFQISKEVKLLLNNYSKNKILPYYGEIQNILDDSTKDIIVENLDKNVKNLKNNYIFNDFDKKAINIRTNLRNLYFKNITNYINYSYKTIDKEYSDNLNKEIANFENLRRLNNDEIEANKLKIADKNLNKTFYLIKNSTLYNIDYIQNLYLFYTFDDNINKYINEINEQYNNSQINIKNRNYNETIYFTLNKKLDGLKDYIIDYYNRVNISFYETKNFIKISLKEINELIEKCIYVTFSEINKKYDEIKINFNSIKYNVKKDLLLGKDKHIEKMDEISYIIDTEIDKILIDNEISLDLIFEEGDIKIPKILGKIINKNRPNRMIIDFYANYGNICQIKGERMTINFNEISMVSNFEFDSSLNKMSVNNTIDFDEYKIRSEKYTIIEKNFVKVLGGITFIIPNLCKSTLDGNNKIAIIDAKKESKFDSFDFTY